MSSIVCDASVLFKLVVAEPDSDKAASLVRSAHVIVPEFVFLEVGNGLWFRVNRRDLSSSEATRLLTDLLAMGFEVQAIRTLLQRALALAATIDHPIYDCAYLALAQSLSVPLVTADQRFLNALKRRGVDAIDVRSLAEFA